MWYQYHLALWSVRALLYLLCIIQDQVPKCGDTTFTPWWGVGAFTWYTVPAGVLNHHTNYGNSEKRHRPRFVVHQGQV